MATTKTVTVPIADLSDGVAIVYEASTGSFTTAAVPGEDLSGTTTSAADIEDVVDELGGYHTLYSIPFTDDGIYSAIATVMISRIGVGSTVDPTAGGMLRTTASWSVLLGVPTLIECSTAASEAGGAIHNVHADLDDIDLDITVSGGAVIVRVSASVDPDGVRHKVYVQLYSLTDATT